MKTIVACLLAGSFLIIDTHAQPKAGPPPLVPVAQLAPPSERPAAGLARINDDGRLVLRFWTVRHERVVATRIVRNGKEVEEKVVFYRPVNAWQESEYNVQDLRYLRSDGKYVEAKLIPFLLKEEKPVLYVFGDAPIDPLFLKVLRKDTLILILRPRPGPGEAPKP